MNESKLNLNTCIGKAHGLVDDETEATFWPTNAGAIFAATKAAFRVADVDLATLYADAANDYMLWAYDTAGKVAKGYIDVADDAEALGAAVVDDDCADDDTGDWSVIDCTLNFVAADGDTAHYTIDYTTGSQYTYIVNKVTDGVLYKWTMKIRDGTLAGEAFSLVISNGGSGISGSYASTTTAEWVAHTVYIIGPIGTSDDPTIVTSMEGAGNIKIKDISIEPVTHVGEDGILIMSAKGGTTQSWTSQETGIDLNDIATFDILIAK